MPLLILLRRGVIGDGSGRVDTHPKSYKRRESTSLSHSHPWDEIGKMSDLAGSRL